MNHDLAECGRENECVRNGAPPPTISARCQALAERFPAAWKGLLSILDQAIFSGTSFLSAVIIARMTAPDELGWYYLVLSVIQIVASVQDSMLWSPYIVHCKRRQGTELAEYSGSVWSFCLIFFAAVSAMLLVLIGALSAANQTSITAGLWALLGAAPFILFRFAVRRFAFANLHVRSAIVLDAVVALGQLGGLGLLGSSGRMTLVNIYLVMGGASGLACLGLYLIDPPKLRFVRDRFLSDWRFNWSFAKWALRSNLTGTTTPILILWILGLMVDADTVGVFGACLTLVGMTNVLLVGIDNVLTPQASHAYASGTVNDLRRILTRTAAFLILTLGGLCLFVFLSGDWLAVSVFGADYQGTGMILLALSFTALMNSVSMVSGGGLWIIDRPRANFQADLSCLGVTLFAAALLIAPWGALGAALALLAGATVAAVVRCLTLARHLDGVHSTSQISASADYAPNVTSTTAAS